RDISATYPTDPGVLYFSLYAALTFSFIFSLRTWTARILIPRLRPYKTISPCGSLTRVCHQPFGFDWYERTKTRPSTTTTQTPMTRCVPSEPARMPRILSACSFDSTSLENGLLVFMKPL